VLDRRLARVRMTRMRVCGVGEEEDAFVWYVLEPVCRILVSLNLNKQLLLLPFVLACGTSLSRYADRLPHPRIFEFK
jgi:hypothetical protein